MATQHAFQAPLRVLVVDDDQDCADTTGDLLKALGCEVVVVVRGAEAAQHAAEFVPDLILLDLGMPNLNGFDVARIIRNSPVGRDVVMVAVTGYADELTRQRCRDGGFDRHLAKPVAVHQFKELLQELRRPRDRPS
jgi:CheY-like chemotaxis protein